ncbi:DUF4345 domain-containing protein [Planomonospora alba]|uniref:DUF4345 domain-containing protein n=1 Tax=Planomonospora alba TaxID=161354 RepID=A0ABP6NAA6_9ACTN
MFVILLAALFFLAMGVYGLLMPAGLIRPFRMSADTPDARTEIRAVYGGFGVAMAAVLALAAADAGHLGRGAVMTVAAALLGMAIGRLAARAVERPSAFYPSWLYFWIELVIAAALLAVTRSP